MHVIVPHEPFVTLFCVSGKAWHYPSKAHALRALGLAWIREHVVADYCVFAGFDYSSSFFRGDVYSCTKTPRYASGEYILRDDQGNKLTSFDFEPALSRRRRGYRHPLDNYPGYGPVPRTGRFRGGHLFRRPRTANEIRQSQVMEPGLEPAPRASRDLRYLIDPWDDYPRSGRRDRNWKRFRKAQWKGAPKA